MKKRKLFNIALATSMATAAIVAVAPVDAEAAKSFSDLAPTDPHYPNVMNLTERGVINGYPDGTFKPYEPIHRGHAAKILALALGLDTKNVKDPDFKDISKSYPYYGEIAALVEAGIINGFEDGTYGPNKHLTRGQMAKIISRAYELKGDTKNLPFTDIAISPYKEEIAALYDNKVTVGSTPTTFSPVAPVTRGQLASFVVRAEAATAAVEETIVEIKDGKVITETGSYEITEELQKVFNEDNAAALKDAKVKVVIDKVNSDKIKGIQAITLVAPYTTFNADGYKIPSVTIEANGVEVSNLKADKVIVEKDVRATLEEIEVKELVAKEDAELTLDADSKIQKLVIPKGASIDDVVTNFDDVKDAIDRVVDSTGKKVDTDTPPAGGGGGGGAGGGTSNTELVQKALDDLNKNENFKKFISPFGDIQKIDHTNKKIIVKVSSNAKTLADLRKDLVNSQDKFSVFDLIGTDSNVGTLYDNVNKVTIVATKANDNAVLVLKKGEISNAVFEPKKETIKNLVKNFIDDLSSDDITTLGDLANTYGESGKQKIKVTVDFKSGTDPEYTIVLLNNPHH